MKSKFLTIAILIMAFTFSSFAQTDKEIDAIVKDIKAKYADVNKNVKKATMKNWAVEEEGFNGEKYVAEGADFYYFNNMMIKIHYGAGTGDLSGESEFYYDNGKLFFFFEKSDITLTDQKEIRCYFKDGKMIKYLYNEINNGKKKPQKDIQMNSKDFKDQQVEVLNKEKELLDSQNKAK